ncbi:MAG: efflux RND transporter periplasmic adaptor subunit [Marinobacter sp.]|uniref:efflux RND transporter periplasmic adaptor subunit n=1 Tax=Marinobacter sp. TaxID=50741 RepID=UPI00299D32D2|nr:efflux RND transporter periplasmic adaptor subunit [Marinobacter sp.]MDX1634024.1 efflux RND transporter periplasmic adaptor subunit [Marinobacter sp.]
MKPALRLARLWHLALLVPALLMIVTGCRGHDPARTAEAEPVTVRVATVANSEGAAPTLRFAGIVQASQRATLTFQVSGNLKERRVELGQRVEAGDVLARLYNPGLEPARASAGARLQELGTQLEQAEREWQRSSQLRERGVVSEQALEQITARRDGLKASVATARAALAEAEQMLAESVLTAPFDGRVVALMVEQEEFVAPGQPVVKLAEPDTREVEIRMPAYLLDQLQVDQQVPVWPVQDRQLAPVSGRVIEVAQAGAERGQLQPVLVALPADAPGLGVGEPVEVGVTPSINGQLTVPVLAVMRASDGNSVFRVRDDAARRVPVTVQRIIGEQVVVASDQLSAGDQVVYAGLTRLADGDRVEILP